VSAVCPNCGSEQTRRGGTKIWAVYLLLIAAGAPAVLLFRMNAGIVAAIMLVAVVLAHLVFAQRVCQDCGHQWKI
jgi:hypothetical protein